MLEEKLSHSGQKAGKPKISSQNNVPITLYFQPKPSSKTGAAGDKEQSPANGKEKENDPLAANKEPAGDKLGVDGTN